jgi:hypothetical protein
LHRATAPNAISRRRMPVRVIETGRKAKLVTEAVIADATSG